MMWATAWKTAAKRRGRVWRYARSGSCVCEAGKVRVGDGHHWRYEDCPFCEDRRRAEAAERRAETLAEALRELSRRASDPDLFRHSTGTPRLMLEHAITDAEVALGTLVLGVGGSSDAR